MKGSLVLMPNDLDTFMRNLAPRCHVCAKTATRMHVPEKGHTFWKAEVGLFRIVMGIPSIFSAKELQDTFRRHFDGLLQKGFCPELGPYLKGEILIRPWEEWMGPFLCDEHTVLQGQLVVDLDYAHLVRGVVESGEWPTRFERILNFDA